MRLPPEHTEPDRTAPGWQTHDWAALVQRLSVPDLRGLLINMQAAINHGDLHRADQHALRDVYDAVNSAAALHHAPFVQRGQVSGLENSFLRRLPNTFSAAWRGRHASRLAGLEAARDLAVLGDQPVLKADLEALGFTVADFAAFLHPHESQRRWQDLGRSQMRLFDPRGMQLVTLSLRHPEGRFSLALSYRDADLLGFVPAPGTTAGDPLAEVDARHQVDLSLLLDGPGGLARRVFPNGLRADREPRA